MRIQSFRSQRDGQTRVAGAVALVMVLGFVGCGGSGGAGVGDKGLATMRSRAIEHEACDIDSKSAETVDANGDGHPDLSIVKSGAKELCRAADLDFDGRIDMWTYLDDAGRLRRRELDYDRDGNIDEIQLYKAGEISEKHRASTPAKRLDTWEFYTAGRLVRAERDSDSNGRVDQWWDYKTPDCPIIRADADGNGEPDPSTEVDYCKESGYKPPEPTAPAIAPMLQKQTDALPTETSNRAEASEKSGEAMDAKAGASSPAEAGKSGEVKTDPKAPAGSSASDTSGKGDGK